MRMLCITIRAIAGLGLLIQIVTSNMVNSCAKGQILKHADSERSAMARSRRRGVSQKC